MPWKNFVEESKKNYGRETDQGIATNEIQVGCLQRIAVATERMAVNWENLERDRDHYKKLAEDRRDSIEYLHRKISTLKGHNTRLRNKLKSK